MAEAHGKRTDRPVYMGGRDFVVGVLFVPPLCHCDRDERYILPKDIAQVLAARTDAQHSSARGWRFVFGGLDQQHLRGVKIKYIYTLHLPIWQLGVVVEFTLSHFN